MRERTYEIGIRRALGAHRSSILWTALKDGAIMVVPGAAIGLVLALPLTGFIEGLLFGVSALDPVTFALVPVLFLGAGLVAGVTPAMRAMQVSAVSALGS